MSDLKQTYIFRIAHIGNLTYMVRSGLLHAPLHPDADPAYIQIGDKQLTGKRGQTAVPLGPGGTFRDYVAFYFAPRQPMLYCIKHGNENVTKRPMNEIVYMVTSVEAVAGAQLPFVFYDGHAYDDFSTPYTDLEQLSEVDRDAVKAKYWKDDNDPDLKRRKQAEFLVHHEMPFSLLSHIVTYDDASAAQVQAILSAGTHRPEVLVKPVLYF